MIELETQEQVETQTPVKHGRKRHFVEMIDGKPADKCLCGYLWDIFPIPFDPEAGICEECVEELIRRKREQHGEN